MFLNWCKCQSERAYKKMNLQYAKTREKSQGNNRTSATIWQDKRKSMKGEGARDRGNQLNRHHVEAFRAILNKLKDLNLLT